jgi:hypothetical protein
MTALRRVWEWIRWPAPYEGPILEGRIDGFAYLLGWLATFAHLALWVVVLVLELRKPWHTVSTIASIIATLLLLSLVIVIHRRMGHHGKLPKEIVWQWWLGPWDAVGRLVWLPVRLPEATRALFGMRSALDDDDRGSSEPTEVLPDAP